MFCVLTKCFALIWGLIVDRVLKLIICLSIHPFWLTLLFARETRWPLCIIIIIPKEGVNDCVKSFAVWGSKYPRPPLPCCPMKKWKKIIKKSLLDMHTYARTHAQTNTNTPPPPHTTTPRSYHKTTIWHWNVLMQWAMYHREMWIM